MSLVSFSMKHGRTQDEARARLADALAQLQASLGMLVERIEWSEDRNSAKIIAPGVQISAAVDPTDVHVTADVPLLGKIVGRPLVAGLKNALQLSFEKKPS